MAGLTMDAPGVVTKTVLFATFTKALDLLGAPLARNGIGHLRLDGTMSLLDRADAIREFYRSPEVRPLNSLPPYLQRFTLDPAL